MIPEQFLPQYQAVIEQLLPSLIAAERTIMTPTWAVLVAARFNVPVPAVSAVGGIVALLIARAILRTAANLVASAVGFAYPAYMTLKTLQAKSDSDKVRIIAIGIGICVILLRGTVGMSRLSCLFFFLFRYFLVTFSCLFALADGLFQDAERQWMSYWTIYAALGLVESALGRVGRNGGMMYYVAKIGALAWAFHPATRGALVVHAKVIQPLFAQYNAQVEAKAEEVRAAVAEKVESLRKRD